ncbi:major facilitator superfamily-domain-containing protein [Bipolaris maydis]|nr:major facilitator superfamily-domain-containing protein [Bipolaris maydis]KAJ6192305.1 major facilitator superfamily-domain-containing protein [Bipolaris maydis]
MAVPTAMLQVLLLSSTFLVAIDATGIVLAVSTITGDLGGNATESFWVGAAYLLSMCLVQPIVSRLFDIFIFKSLVLASIVMLGIGSLLCESADGLPLLLIGRTVQGLGAGGLTTLSYAVYDQMKNLSGSESSNAVKFLAAISFFAAAGTICGPFIGAALSNNHQWRWIFRLNIPTCIVLGVLVYNCSDVPGRDTSPEPKASARNSRDIPNTEPPTKKLSDMVFIDITLFIMSVVPLLVGLSFAGSLYRWNEWQVIAPIATGGVFLLLLIVRELWSASASFPPGSRHVSGETLDGLKLLKERQNIIIFGGAFWLGLLMYALLFFLPIYYRVVKERSAITTAIFLLPQTLMMAPCAGVVLVLVRWLRLHHSSTLLLGWFCTAIGMGLLALLGAEKSAASDVSLNLLSGFGIGLLLPALAYSAQESTRVENATRVFIFTRYLGSASGLVIAGLVFQRVLRSNLGSTKFSSEADNMTRYATKFMYSIQQMSSPEDKQILTHVTEMSLRTLWLVLSLLSLAMFLLSFGSFVVGREQQGRGSQMNGRSTDSVSSPRNTWELPIPNRDSFGKDIILEKPLDMGT